jgi:anti-sigma regulatory factor (Ser/Thr protein kinase)
MPESGTPGATGSPPVERRALLLIRMAKRLTVDFRRVPTAPRAARAALAGFDHGLSPRRLLDAELLLSELVSNAVKYGGDGDLTLHLERVDHCFRAEVVDQGDGFPFERRDADDLRTPGGWGLHMVETLSDRWGAHRGSTHVWFELAL